MWLTLALLSYFFLAFAAFLDKYILEGAIPSPKVYSFYNGLLSLSVLIVVPIGIILSSTLIPTLQILFPDAFAIFYIPKFSLMLLSISTGAIFFFALYSYYKAVFSFEVSRIGPAVGGLVPLFTFGLIYVLNLVFSELGFGKQVFAPRYIAALILLILGSVVLSLHKEKLATFKSIKISVITSFLFSLSFVMAKLVYISLPFWTGFIWIKIGSALVALTFLVFPEVRRSLVIRKRGSGKKVAFPFISAKIMGALGNIFQNGAVYLVPIIFLPIINALTGIQYVFLIILSTILFFKFPNILKEKVTKEILSQKVMAILLIAIGLALFAL